MTDDKPTEPTLTLEQKWALARADHTCACVNCDYTLKLPTERAGKQHIGVRFWETNPDEKREQYGRYVLVDGVQVAAVEAILGDEGIAWVIRGRDKPFGCHICLTCMDGNGYMSADSAACMQKLYGKVELQ